jgi:hypothetical protein
MARVRILARSAIAGIARHANTPALAAASERIARLRAGSNLAMAAPAQIAVLHRHSATIAGALPEARSGICRRLRDPELLDRAKRTVFAPSSAPTGDRRVAYVLLIYFDAI